MRLVAMATCQAAQPQWISEIDLLEMEPAAVWHPHQGMQPCSSHLCRQNTKQLHGEDKGMLVRVNSLRHTQ